MKKLNVRKFTDEQLLEMMGTQVEHLEIGETCLVDFVVGEVTYTIPVTRTS